MKLCTHIHDCQYMYKHLAKVWEHARFFGKRREHFFVYTINLHHETNQRAKAPRGCQGCFKIVSTPDSQA